MLLRFGKNKYLQALKEGKLRFTPAKTYQDIESDQGKKGIGDKFDSYVRFKGVGGSMVSVICDECDKIPMLCFYRLKGDELKFNQEEFKRIQSDFEQPDSVLVIKDEASFFENVQGELNKTVFGADVVYLEDNIINSSRDALMYLYKGRRSDIEFLPPDFKHGEYYMEINIKSEEDPVNFKVDHSNAYLTMYYKDLYFASQKEFRFVIPGEQIDGPITKDVGALKDAEIYDIETFKKYIV